MLPLEGLRVIECAEVLAGPYCGMLLADAGAEVIKIERPQVGDTMRENRPPDWNGEAAIFLGVNRNKKSVTLNIRHPAGQDLLRRLAAGADVFIENFRTGVMERNGLGYERLSELNPRLVYCSISGFGRTGPYAERACFDIIAQGMSGQMSFTGEPGGRPVKAGVPISDLGAATLAALHIMIAVHARQRTGVGQLVETSLLEAAVAWTVWDAALYWATGEVSGPLGSAHRVVAPYQALKARDGYLTINAGRQKQFELFCRLTGAERLIDDARFLTLGDRRKNLDDLVVELEKDLAKKRRDEWLEIFREHGFAAGPIYTMDEVWNDPQIKHRGLVAELVHPVAGQVKAIAPAARLSATPTSVRTPAPTLGQHTDEVLKKLGLGAADLRALKRAGAI